MPPHIRHAHRADIEQIASLVSDYWKHEGLQGFDRAHIADLLAHVIAHPEVATCWLAEHDGALAAYLLIVYMFSLEHRGMMAEVDELYVAPDQRSRGLGKLMIEIAEKEIMTTGIVRIQLQLNPENGRAKQFYLKQHYQPHAYVLLDKVL